MSSSPTALRQRGDGSVPVNHEIRTSSLASSNPAIAGNSGSLVATVSTAAQFNTTVNGFQGDSTGGTDTVDGTIELQVINTGASIAVQETFVASNSGVARSKAACGPPTMMVSVACLAPTSPPETGASR